MKEKTSERSIWKAISFLKKLTRKLVPKALQNVPKCFLGICKTDIDKCVHTSIPTAHPISGCIHTHIACSHTHICTPTGEYCSFHPRSLTDRDSQNRRWSLLLLAPVLLVGPAQFHLPQCQRALLGESQSDQEAQVIVGHSPLGHFHCASAKDHTVQVGAGMVGTHEFKSITNGFQGDLEQSNSQENIINFLPDMAMACPSTAASFSAVKQG